MPAAREAGLSAWWCPIPAHTRIFAWGEQVGYIVEPMVERYIASLDECPDPVLAEMEEMGARRGFPIVGPQVGRLLGMLARLAGARRVLEMGSGFGYSAYWLARALPADGRIICTDLSSENRDLALGFLERGGLMDRVEFHVGDALRIARAQRGPFDLIFNDIEKQAYPDSIHVALPLLRTGGLFITDNTLWKGKVAESKSLDATTAAVVEFNRMVSSHPSLETVLLPVRDGVAVCRKIA